jgi:hypothetical protein
VNPITNDIARLHQEEAEAILWCQDHIHQLGGLLEQLRTRLTGHEVRLAAIDAIAQQCGILICDPRVAAHLDWCRRDKLQEEAERIEREIKQEIPL